MQHELEAAAKFLEKEDARLQQEGRAGAVFLDPRDACTAATSSARLGLTDSKPSESLLEFGRRPAPETGLEGSPDIDDELRAMREAADGFHSLLASVPGSPDAEISDCHFLDSSERRCDDLALCQQSRKDSSKQGQGVSGFADENAGLAVSERYTLLDPLFQTFT